MLAISTMDPTITALFYIVAVALFIVATFTTVARINIIALGLACAFIPLAWNALAAA